MAAPWRRRLIVPLVGRIRALMGLIISISSAQGWARDLSTSGGSQARNTTCGNLKGTLNTTLVTRSVEILHQKAD